MSSDGSLQLSYAFVPDPNPIRASVGGANPNQVSLQVIISNPNAPDVVTLQGISIEIPVGGEIGGDLSAAKNLPNPVPATSGAWNITASGSTVSILPQTGVGTTATLADTLTLTLPHITVNKETGTVRLTITEIDQDGNSTADTSHTLVKLDPNFQVTSFEATPDLLNNMEQTVTLKWTCSDQGQGYTYRVYSVDPESKRQPGPKSWMPKECLKNGDCYTCASGSHGVVTPKLVPAPETMWDPLESTCRHASLSIL